MARGLGTWMCIVRLFQLIAALVMLAMNGFLTGVIATRKLGLSTNMITIEVIAGLVMLYSIIQVFVLHSLHKSSNKRYLLNAIVWDLLFTGVVLANLTILAVAGVPNNCLGMTRANYNPGDTPNDPAPGFTTVRFGPGTFGNYGELDIYCDLPRTCYALSILIIFSYMASVTLVTIRIISYKYTRPSDLEAKHINEKTDNASTSEQSVSSWTPTLPALSTDRQCTPHSRSQAPQTYGSESVTRPDSSASMACIFNGSRERRIDVAAGNESERSTNPPPYVPSGPSAQETNGIRKGWM